MAEITVDDSLFPIVHIRFPRQWTQLEWDAHVARVLVTVKRGACVIVNDARRAPMPNARERKSIADANQSEHFRRNVKAVGVVISNPALRAVGGLINLVAGTSVPQQHFATAVEAEEWCRAQLAAKRVA